MKQRGKRIAMVLFSILPLLMVLAVYRKLPEQVPLQWGLDGVSRYGKKWELVPLAGMNILFGVLMPLLAKIDPKRKNYQRFQKTYDGLILGLLIFLTIMVGLTLVESIYPNTLNMPKAVCMMLALLFIFIGNRMPKVKQNFFTGAKTPWALSNDVVWNKTQRLGGKIFFFGGILLLLATFILKESVFMGIVIGVAAAVCLVPAVMSYIWYQQEMRKGEE